MLQRSAFSRIEKDGGGVASKQRERSKILDREREKSITHSEWRIYVYYDK